ncbi:MAG: hypothetical protein KGJ29_11480, partial [Hyphomicrobiales bacterium]|nr:hypothetical protein [Hyphomicrobiales bacterium]
MSNKLHLDIPVWLEGLALGGYTAAFIKHDIDSHLLLSLTADDLVEIGVLSVGHRRRILSEIAKLKLASPTQPLRPAHRKIVDVPAKDPPAGAAPAKPDTELQAPELHVQAQWRPVTLLFCDMVGAQALQSHADVEDVQFYMADFLAMLTRAIAKFNGTVATYFGDGIVAHFGYPQLLGNDTERAVQAGLHILDEVSKFAALERHRPQVRIGAATGMTIISNTVGPGEVLAEGAI